METARIVAALSRLPGTAAEQCREDLALGARVVMLPGLVDAGELRATYRRRAEHLAGAGVDALVAFEAVELLEGTDHTDLALGKVEGGPSGSIFQLFLTPDRDEAVACIAVAPARSSDPGSR